MVSLITEDVIRPEPPKESQTAALFAGVGWAGFHSALDKPQEDTFFLFKSSPFGSVSHSHADQNSFCILKGGKALAIPSGHYGPSYGMPHHAAWTRQTKANNSVLINGEGQVVRSAEAKGKIVDFKHQKAISYLCGDATAAYSGRLTKFLRHVLFLRPGVFLLLDELESPGQARYQWLLHSFEEMKIHESEGEVTSSRDEAYLRIRLASEGGLSFSQTDQFDPPFNEGNPKEYQREVPNHWHFTASTKTPEAKTYIAAVMLVGTVKDDLSVVWKKHPGWMGISTRTAEGEGKAWIRFSPSSSAPEGVNKETRMSACWVDQRGGVEEMTI
jgi:hypothetical protein